jgi:hypothetical protein
LAAEIVRAGIASSASRLADDGELVEIEGRCEALAARHAVLVDAGSAEWPDGTVSGRHRFIHQMVSGGALRAADSGPTMIGAIVTGTNFNGVTWFFTTCPDGTTSNNNGGTCFGHL